MIWRLNAFGLRSSLTLIIHPTHYSLGTALAKNGQHDEAIAEMFTAIKLSDGDPKYNTNLAWVYTRAGRRSEARKILEQIEGSFTPEDNKRRIFEIAGIYAELGDKDKAFAWLEKAFEIRAPYLIWLKVEPQLDKLHGDPRFDDMLKRLGLPA